MIEAGFLAAVFGIGAYVLYGGYGLDKRGEDNERAKWFMVSGAVVVLLSVFIFGGSLKNVDTDPEATLVGSEEADVESKVDDEADKASEQLAEEKAQVEHAALDKLAAKKEEEAYIEFLKVSVTPIGQYTGDMGSVLQEFDYSEESMVKVVMILEQLRIATDTVINHKTVPDKYKLLHDVYVNAATEYRDVAIELPGVLANRDSEKLQELNGKIEVGTAGILNMSEIFKGMQSE